MKNILNKIKIDNITYLLILVSLLSGYIKNMFIIFMIVLIHEMGHVFFFYIFNIEIESISIYPFGGLTKVNKRIHERIYKDVLISLGGIVFQLILFILVYVLYRRGIVVASTYNMFNLYNRSIIIFNLIPIIPLDGSKLLFAICSKFMSFKCSYILMTVIGFISLLIFMVSNFVLKINDLIINLFLIFNLYLVIRDMKYVFNKFYLERILYDNYYDGIVSGSCMDKMRIDKYYYFYNGKKYINERDYLLNKN